MARRRRRGCRARRSQWSPPSTIGIAPASSTSPTVRSIASWVRGRVGGQDRGVAVVDHAQLRRRRRPRPRGAGPAGSSRRGSRAGRSGRPGGRRRGRRSARRRSPRRRRRARPGPRCRACRRRSAARRSRASPRTLASARADRSSSPQCYALRPARLARRSARDASRSPKMRADPGGIRGAACALPGAASPPTAGAGSAAAAGPQDLLRRQRHRRPGRLRPFQQRPAQAPGADRDLPHLGHRTSPSSIERWQDGARPADDPHHDRRQPRRARADHPAGDRPGVRRRVPGPPQQALLGEEDARLRPAAGRAEPLPQRLRLLRLRRRAARFGAQPTLVPARLPAHLHPPPRRRQAGEDRRPPGGRRPATPEPRMSPGCRGRRSR